jgi:hypothetical protein
MRLSAWRKILCIILILFISVCFLIPVSDIPISKEFASSSSLKPNVISSPLFIININNQPNLVFFKTLKATIGRFKFVDWLELRAYRSNFSLTQNLNVTSIAIILFAIYYLLSRTCSEKPALAKYYLI